MDDTSSQGFPPELDQELEHLHATPAAERTERIRSLCERFPDHAIEIEVLGRLHADEDAEAVAHPQEIGPYRIVEPIGEGGMGVVYLARQETPIRRRVALKLIKLGMDSKAIVARFEQERQALAMMDHDGIAKVFDCGTTATGQPYFVMEYVEGLPIHAFCDRHELSLTARLRVMQQVCAAVEHAHQKGVVHRDLKPSNVLVSGEPTAPQVKVIDFGLAKAVGEQVVGATMFTQAGQIVGTPEYMAPEQADPGNRDIDTRADVYSLGVILYRLLVGELPFAAAELRRGGMVEIQRILRTVDPPRPSSRVSSTTPGSGELAAARRLSVTALRAALRNDLDWVVLKALEKDRDQRYATANALAADLQRFLDHEPLQAGPPSASYRLRKLARRYRAQVAAAAAVLVTAIVGTAFAWSYALSAAGLAAEKTALAGKLDARIQDYGLLASVVHYDEVVAAEQDLVPAWPRRIPAMEHWLDHQFGPLHDQRTAIEDAIGRLEKMALPWTEEERRRDLESFEGRERWQRARQLGEALARADRIRAGAEQLVVPELGAEWDAMTPTELIVAAIRRIQPQGVIDSPISFRSIYGEEALGLALAQRGVTLAGDPPPSVFEKALAEALHENGQDTEALRIIDDLMSRDQERITMKDWANWIRQRVANPAAFRDKVEREVAQLEVEATRRRTFTFPPDRAAEDFLYHRLIDLAGRLEELTAAQEQRVRRRLEWAAAIERLSQDHPNAKVTWQATREGIADSPRYAGCAIELLPEDCMGLVPLGENPVTGLWEFYHLRSAWDGKADPAALPIPMITATGSIAVGNSTGIVFVLLPGGRQSLGRPRNEREIPLEQQLGGVYSMPHEVELEPFFIARHELTNGQWYRLWTGPASGRRPSWHGAGNSIAGSVITDFHPVDNVDWNTSQRLLAEHGLGLPTDDQWEYACRAGTSTEWSCPREELRHHANFADAAGRRQVPSWSAEPWDDGHPLLAPVGAFLSNAFGLYDMHGNVSEWCFDRPPASGWISDDRPSRGGSCASVASLGASDVRPKLPRTHRAFGQGLRAMRRLRP
ncbi:MAG: protein kinase [Planctomycetes bacterium]|nr:protein kinase [Planctomycetota bacterium]